MPSQQAPSRKRSTRQAQAQAAASAALGRAAPDQIARRKKRQLDELERSNYTEPKFSVTGVEEDAEEGSSRKDRMRTTISDAKRKSSLSVRRVLLYRKGLNTLLEEFASATTPNPTPNYTTATAPPPKAPRRPFCSVCGYWGAYACGKCSMHYCTIPCRDTHDETRCERRVL